MPWPPRWRGPKGGASLTTRRQARQLQTRSGYWSGLTRQAWLYLKVTYRGSHSYKRGMTAFPFPLGTRLRTSRRLFALLKSMMLAAGVLGVAYATRAEEPSPLPTGQREAADAPGLHHVFRLSTKLYSGGAPEGDAGFRTLQQWGIRTLISVDGEGPDVERAHRYGMRYVHIPFGYDGCPTPTAHRIVRAVRDVPGPIYLHCHHGKHRGPAAAAFSRIALDGLPHVEAVAELERAGTDPRYAGLYRDVRTYRPPTPAELDAVDARFPEVAPTPPMTTAMVEIHQRFARLQASRKHGWKREGRSKELTPAQEALQLQELFAELQRTPGPRRWPPEFHQWMRASETDADRLEIALRGEQKEQASLFLDRLGAACGSCHARYRDTGG